MKMHRTHLPHVTEGECRSRRASWKRLLLVSNLAFGLCTCRLRRAVSRDAAYLAAMDLSAASREVIVLSTSVPRRLLASMLRHLRLPPAGAAPLDGQPPPKRRTAAAVAAGELPGRAARARVGDDDSTVRPSGSPADDESASSYCTSTEPQPTPAPARGDPGHELQACPATSLSAGTRPADGISTAAARASAAVQRNEQLRQRQLQARPAAKRGKPATKAVAAELRPGAAACSSDTALSADPVAGASRQAEARQGAAADDLCRESAGVAAAKSPSARAAVGAKKPTRKQRVFEASAFATFAALLTACGVGAVSMTWHWRSMATVGARFMMRVPHAVFDQRHCHDQSVI